MTPQDMPLSLESSDLGGVVMNCPLLIVHHECHCRVRLSHHTRGITVLEQLHDQLLLCDYNSNTWQPRLVENLHHLAKPSLGSLPFWPNHI